MTTVSTLQRNGLQRIVCGVASGAGLALAALMSYELTIRILTNAISSRHDQMLGRIWPAVETLFVCRALLQSQRLIFTHYADW